MVIEMKDYAQGIEDSFLYAVYKKSMQVYVAQTYGWDEDLQKNGFLDSLKTGTTKSVVLNCVDVGLINYTIDCWKLSLRMICILPEWQGLGIGTAILRQIIDLAKEIQKPIYLSVMKSNVHALRWYQEIGFQKVEENPHKVTLLLP
jgi:ribosomal protein S18 acetylase RimI-like enzyme